MKLFDEFESEFHSFSKYSRKIRNAIRGCNKCLIPSLFDKFIDCRLLTSPKRVSNNFFNERIAVAINKV